MSSEGLTRALIYFQSARQNAEAACSGLKGYFRQQSRSD